MINGVLTPDDLMTIPKLRNWKREEIRSDWIAALAVDSNQLEILINEDHVNAKYISNLKVYLEADDFLVESHFLRTSKICKYFHHLDKVVFSSYQFYGELYHTTFSDLRLYRK